mgnify:CR=1 FL=1
MSDYEEEYSQNGEYDSPSSPNGQDETVTVPVIVVLKKENEEKNTTVYVRFFDDGDAYDAETSGYTNCKSAIDAIATRRYPGWSVSRYITESFSSGSYYDLDFSTE